MSAKPNDLQLNLAYQNPGQDFRMSCRIHKHNAVTPWMKTMNSRSRQEPATSSSPLDRTIVLEMCAELARVGYGILEDLPVVNSQNFHLKSGEIYWLGPHEVMRIQ
ncbi:hypothetical protein AciPR4_2889 [Terriglobus saanensis SP1PR4]|uniref:Uncharacterized protein n=1 Tax=Terriglobus saanensis (strain ATCC BAA-1853 / DSM 23119 / SP1PR4) TaxID=401053 RepID=E8V4A5_TERSS|nr:hypothetical protein AciPR4_2889 [Terriglobus saanensis SP1PR4]